MSDDENDLTTLRLRIEGFVQAVGYRHYAIEEAKKLGIDGWIYIGVTSDLLSRVRQHKDHQYKDSFTDRYDVTTLVWYEALGDAESAITREKQMKEWRRAWKVELIQKTNPQWRDLWDEVLALYGYRE